MIEARGAALEYSDHGRPVFACQDVDLRVESGEFLGILGPSGSGKSSLLYLLSGLKIPTTGEVSYNGENLTGMHEEERSRLRLRDFGFVFQQPYLLGYLTALENVLVATPAVTRPDDALALLEDLNLGPKSHRLPHELSGGERQRVCVARSLLGRPKVVFADEPTASLDHKNGVAVVQLLNRLRGSGSLVMVTHDPSMLEEADRVVRIVEGRIEPSIA
ncbi:ABC transporter ATP-binding protein [Fimbriimonas ginsengisoli]|uniref:Phosphonate-transporting ATPase n=1 Tax=Fimbriimonas ginsengisoli Gsoil 348 TaxID=661478 RepID=A0A068NXA0_FIMGI|nr:ATP-binding cassette domain-containing protein [Fimbriimonas ginsengisoli]AIE86259.1 phosphonate-transporting ATPase [Fimbriimonas ginsengisoli Gsoil 348]